MRLPLSLSIAGHTVLLGLLILLTSEVQPPPEPEANAGIEIVLGQSLRNSRPSPPPKRRANRPLHPPSRPCRRRRLKKPSRPSRRSSHCRHRRRKARPRRFEPNRSRHRRQPKSRRRRPRHASPSEGSRRKRSHARPRAQFSPSRPAFRPSLLRCRRPRLADRYTQCCNQSRPPQREPLTGRRTTGR
jgi:hypothetical protein